MIAALAVACDEQRFTNITQVGRGLTMNVRDLQRVDGIVYRDLDGEFYNVGPVQEGHYLATVLITIWNERSGLLSLNVATDSALLDGRDQMEALVVDPYERRVKLESEPAALSPTLPFLWGPSTLPKGFNISGWMVFEVPDEMEILELEWEQVDALRFPITFSE